MALCAFLALAFAAAAALAAVKVYSNGFSDREDSKELRIAGKGCDKDWDSENDRLVVEAKEGPATCRLKVPVQGDTPQPDHALEATAKLEGSTPKSVAKGTYIAISVRDGAGGRYELRIYPQLGRYELRREPEGGGFPVEGRDEAVGKPGERNALRLEAILGSVKAKVNAKRIGPVLDPDAEDIEGRRMTMVLGVEKRTKDPVSAWFDDVAVQVPTP